MVAQGMDSTRAKAVATFLSMAFGRLVNSFTKFCRWQGQDQKTIAAIGDRQALKMVYDFSEINPFAETAGCLQMALDNEVFCVRKLAGVGDEAVVTRGNAENLLYDDATFDAVVTDPPYYSSIFYADLSSFFYVWLRRIVGDLYPEHFTLPSPPKKREAVAQASEHKGDDELAAQHYRELMSRAFSEARRVLKPGGPLVCVYAHKTTEGWASLIKALVPAGLMVTEAWPIQTEAKGRTNALEAAALSDSIFLVARRRETTATGQYETEVHPALERIARERIKTLWANGKGIGGADLLMAAVGAGLRPYTQFVKVEYANGEEVPPERFLQEVEGVVLDTMLEEIFGFSKAGVSSVDALTRFYILWRFTYRESAIEAGDAFVFCYTQGIELDGHDGISGPLPALVEKVRNTYSVRTFTERGKNEDLGLPLENGQAAPLIDTLHRTLWLMEKRPAELARFLRETQPNREQLRLVAQALVGPALKGGEEEDGSPTAELSALAKLTANWQSVVEDAAQTTGEKEERKKGQKQLI
jgi:putative DNA methylase